MKNNISVIDRYIKTFNESGFVVIKKLINLRDMKKFEIEVEKIKSILIKKYKPPFVNLTKDCKVNTAHNLDKIFTKSILLNIKKNLILNKFIKKLFNEEFIIRNLEIFAKPPKTGMAAPFHQDNFYWNVADERAVNVWLSMDKVNKDNGGLMYLKGSHKKPIIKHVISRSKGTSQKISVNIIKKLKYVKITPILNPGDCIIHHCNVIHGSNRNITKNKRRAIVLSFKAKSSKYNKDKLNFYLKRLKKILN
jgi:phytanoyl-CoA hydroxylase